jgi:hypothetical protein
MLYLNARTQASADNGTSDKSCRPRQPILWPSPIGLLPYPDSRYTASSRWTKNLRANHLFCPPQASPLPRLGTAIVGNREEEKHQQQGRKSPARTTVKTSHQAFWAICLYFHSNSILLSRIIAPPTRPRRWKFLR